MSDRKYFWGGLFMMILSMMVSYSNLQPDFEDDFEYEYFCECEEELDDDSMWVKK